MYNKYDVPPGNRVSEAAEFIARVSNADIERAKETLKVFFDATLDDCYVDENKKMTAKAWVNIRATSSDFRLSPTGNYWHRDAGFHRTSETPVQSRYSMTMVGPPTDVLISNAELALLESTRAYPTVSFGTEETIAMDALPKHPIRTGQIYRFTMGERDFPVHSSPTNILTTDSIFVSVVYY